VVPDYWYLTADLFTIILRPPGAWHLPEQSTGKLVQNYYKISHQKTQNDKNGINGVMYLPEQSTGKLVQDYYKISHQKTQNDKNCINSDESIHSPTTMFIYIRINKIYR